MCANYRAGSLQSAGGGGSGCPRTRAGISSSSCILEVLVGMTSPSCSSLNSFKNLDLGLLGALCIAD